MKLYMITKGIRGFLHQPSYQPGDIVLAEMIDRGIPERFGHPRWLLLGRHGMQMRWLFDGDLQELA